MNFVSGRLLWFYNFDEENEETACASVSWKEHPNLVQCEKKRIKKGIEREI